MQAAKEQWKALYEEAASFKRSECWQWMTNSHLFGVQNPDTGEIGYCCILGNGGEVFGLTVYLGTKGLNAVMDMLSGELAEDPLFAQYCLMLSFDSRNELYPQELKQIKELGLTFRGTHAWPTFRLYEPGFVPWPFWSAEQVAFFTLALRQAREVAIRYRSNPDALFHEDDDMFLVRTAIRKDDGDIVWSNQWLRPEPYEEIVEFRAKPIDELRLAKAKKSVKGSAGMWEIDCFFAPIPVKEGERPFYPKMILIVDQGSGQILKHSIIEKTQAPDQLVSDLLSLIEETGLVPAALGATNEEVYRDLAQLLSAFEIKAYVTEELPALQEAKESLLEYFQQV